MSFHENFYREIKTIRLVFTENIKKFSTNFDGIFLDVELRKLLVKHFCLGALICDLVFKIILTNKTFYIIAYRGLILNKKLLNFGFLFF